MIESWIDLKVNHKEPVMHAERVVLITDQAGNPTNLPKLPPNRRVEAIFLTLEQAESDPIRHRRPHPDIAGKTRISGNILDTASTTDWNLPQ